MGLYQCLLAKVIKNVRLESGPTCPKVEAHREDYEDVDSAGY